MSRLRLHRARQASPSAEAPRQRLYPSSPALSRETQPRSGRIIFAKGKFSLERGHVRLVSAHSAARIQPSRAGAGGFHFPTSRSEKLRECFARSLRSIPATTSFSKRMGRPSHCLEFILFENDVVAGIDRSDRAIGGVFEE